MKFKAYLKELDKIYDVDLIDFKNELVTLNKPYGNKEYLFKEVVILPFTGLEGKDKEDIFEGHILEDRDGNKSCIKFSEEDARFYLHMIKDGTVLNKVTHINQPEAWFHKIIGHVELGGKK